MYLGDKNETGAEFVKVKLKGEFRHKGKFMYRIVELYKHMITYYDTYIYLYLPFIYIHLVICWLIVVLDVII